MSFRSRIFFSFTIVTFLMVVASISAVNNRFRHHTLKHTNKILEKSHIRFDSFQTTRIHNLMSQAANISNDPNLRGTYSTGDPATIANAAERIYPLYNTDLFWLIDKKGRVIHQVDKPQDRGVDLSHKAVIRDAMNGYDSADIWLYRNELYQVAAVPILNRDQVMGILLIGMNFDDWLLNSFENLTGLNVAFMSSDQFVQSSTSELDVIKLVKSINVSEKQLLEKSINIPRIPWNVKGPDSEPTVLQTVSFKNQEIPYSGSLFYLQDVSNTVLGKGLVFKSLEQEWLLLKTIRNTLALVGLLAVLLALLLTYFITRGLTKPINKLVTSAHLLGEGDLETGIEGFSSDEIGSLAKALDTMRISLKEAREELIRQERLSAIGQMASTITHDFRQPISAIYGYMQLLMLPDISSDQRSDFSRRVMRQIDRMQGMINEVLDFAKGDFILQKETQSIPDFINEIAENFSHDIRDRNIQLKTNITFDGTLSFDRNRVERGIENIIRNAVQAISKDGEIELEAYDTSDSVHFRITDNGPGIPEEIMETLFEAFVTSDKEGGTGLGLAVAHKVITEHQGSIEVESKIDEGTIFNISLPKS